MIKFDIRDEKTPEEVLKALIFQAMGASSMCWTKIEKAGTFKSTEAVEIGHDLIDALRQHGLINF